MIKKYAKKYMGMINVFLTLIAIITLSVIPKIPVWAYFIDPTPAERTSYQITVGETKEIEVRTSDNGNDVRVTVYRIEPNDSSTEGVVTSVSQPDGNGIRTISVTISEPGTYEIRISRYTNVRSEFAVETKLLSLIVSAAQQAVAPAPISSNSPKVTSPSHTHSYSWVVKTSPTSTTDGEEEYVCSTCGHVSETRTLSAMGRFEEEMVNQIKTASPNSVVKIDTRLWNSFGKEVRDALAERPDVTLKVSFLSEGYKGQLLRVTIPTGIDRKALWDQNGWLGLCRAGSTLGYDKTEQ